MQPCESIHLRYAYFSSDQIFSSSQVHQHQDRGETFQCELCPFTSSRHFSLKLHMRCHQHFPRHDLKVKDEPGTDTEESESLLMGDDCATGDQVLNTDTSTSPSLSQSDVRLLASPGEPSNHVQIKEEPQERDVSVMSPFALCRERPSSSNSSLDLSGLKSSPPGPGPTAASLFSPDITTKTATDLLIKLSGRLGYSFFFLIWNQKVLMFGYYRDSSPEKNNCQH